MERRTSFRRAQEAGDAAHQPRNDLPAHPLGQEDGGDLWRHTRIMSKFGRKRYRSHDSRGVLPGKRSISERPVEVELRRRVGHWEGDTVMGSDLHHCVLTLVERKTGY